MTYPFSSQRLKKRFEDLKADNKSAFITFMTAGDPDQSLSQKLFQALPDAGADIIELGIPFSDPAADGPTIDKASQRALKAGMTLSKTLDMVSEFRRTNTETPLILMGYFNPVFAYGIEKFVQDAAIAGADGLIIVDLPPEEDEELRVPAQRCGLDLIRLATPTSTKDRLPAILEGATGFLYYVAVAGITGQKSASSADIGAAVKRLKAATPLPIAVGFGIRTADQAKAVALHADGTIVGSAIVALIEEGVKNGETQDTIINQVITFVKKLKSGIISARPA